MKKFVIIGIGAVILCAILIIVSLLNIGPIIKNAVNTYGPGITKTNVNLKDVDVSIFSGKATLKGFYLGNPSGFNSPHAMTADTIKLDLDEKTIKDDIIIIDTIELISPDIIYEKKGKTDNFNEIIENVNKKLDPHNSSSGTHDNPKSPNDTPKSKKKSQTSKDKKIVINNLIIRDGTVKMTLPMLQGETINTSLPRIHLKDIGKEEGGYEAALIFAKVLAEIYKSINTKEVTNSIDNLLKDFKKELAPIIKDDGKYIKSLKDKLNKLIDN